jgi:hypothetical protein
LAVTRQILLMVLLCEALADLELNLIEAKLVRGFGLHHVFYPALQRARGPFLFNLLYLREKASCPKT